MGIKFHSPAMGNSVTHVGDMGLSRFRDTERREIKPFVHGKSVCLMPVLMPILMPIADAFQRSPDIAFVSPWIGLFLSFYITSVLLFGGILVRREYMSSDPF